ncbi:MAG: toll/interleukin-1 receptor domain-containing protein [Gammaproteobacteria bacterium]|nr:toll/interleukin-1 receptor domain-containing protein [Gammaproteobacteria bacterium]
MARTPVRQFKYRVFLSYSHEDHRWARWLHRELETFRIPAGIELPADARPENPNRPLAPVFRDREELASAASLTDAVNDALAHSEALVVICSPAAIRSRWVNEEIIAFRRLGRSHRIFCFIIDGDPASNDDGGCFPPALTGNESFQQGLADPPPEPLAADARPQGDGKKDAKLKLLAGLLGVGLDDLRQRELHRRHRRMLAVSAASLVVTSITIALAIMAYLSSLEADRRRAQAEDLVGFMLGDLYENLHEIGRLDVYQSVGDKAMDYFGSLRDEDASDHMLGERARALRQIGTARMDGGKSDLALESYREALAIALTVALRNPDDPDAQIDLANSHFYVGWVHWQRNELDEAQAQFTAVVPIVDSVSARDPQRAEWLVERGYAYTNLGRLLELQGRHEAALDLYREVQSINQRLVELEPENDDYRLEVGFAQNNIGKVLHSLGRLQEAEQHYRADLQIKTDMSSEQPKNNLWRRYLAASHYHLAHLLSARGSKALARQHYLAAIASLDALLMIDPERSDWLNRKASCLRELAALDRMDGDPESAAQRIRDSIQILSGLREVDASNARWEAGIALGRIEAARQSLLHDETEQALDLASSANTSLEKLMEAEPNNQQTRLHLMTARLVLGDVHDATGKGAAAKQYWSDALSQLSADVQNPEALDVRSALLFRLGRHRDAQALAERLAVMGFAPNFTRDGE